MKKYKKILFATVLSLAIPSVTLASGTSYLGSESLSAYAGTIVIDASKYWSTGGDYKVRISGADSTTQIGVFVEEDDPTGLDELVYGVIKNGDGNGNYEFSVEEFVDGTNGKAELRFEISRSQPDAITVEFYD